MILLLFLAEFWVLLTKGKRDFYHGEGRAERRVRGVRELALRRAER